MTAVTTRDLTSLALRVASFAALAIFCLLHYAMLVDPTASGRVFALVAVCALGGVLIAATERVPGRLGTLARIAALLALTVVALKVTGLAARLVLPRNWGELGDGLGIGFAGLDSFNWPYADDEHWVRLTVLLGMPLMAVPAGALAFWPVRPGASAVRAAAVVPLLVAYATGVTNLGLGSWALRGTALLILIAAFLWLPRLRGREGLAGVVAIAGCAVAALPLAASLDADEPWLNYRQWTWFAEQRDGTRFAWDHSYGPISWSRSGTKLLTVRSDEPHYWKAQTLDRFDGLRWIHSAAPIGSGDAVQDIPDPIRRSWNERIRFSIRKLDTRLVIGAGIVYRVDSDRIVAEDPDGTVRVLDDPLSDGDTYTAYAYVPDPSAEEMRAAPRDYPERLVQYTWFDLPSRDQSGFDPPGVSETARRTHHTARTIAPAYSGAPLTAEQVARVEGSPYGRVYELARRLGAGQPTTYDVVRAIEAHLQRGYQYNEKPPRRRYPLPAFLFDDRVGYCQQFSGAMTLMLRMDGIPARVATGFSPGALNRATGEYDVRDLDAHSWVEVWFTDIGWVPFDPTPSLAPASSQSSGNSQAASAARGAREDRGSTRAEIPEGESSSAPVAAPDDGTRSWLLVLGFAALGAAVLLALWLAALMRARPHFSSSAEGAVQELRAALARLGYRFPPRTTLTELERRLRVTNGEDAARYVRSLRVLRYERLGATKTPGPHERRELRRALTAGRGLRMRIRGLLALPPRRRAH